MGNGNGNGNGNGRLVEFVHAPASARVLLQGIARTTHFHDEEIGIGFRVSAGTLAKASYRQDSWQVDPRGVRGSGRESVRRAAFAVIRRDVVDRSRARAMIRSVEVTLSLR